jgi:hypothetical protein
MFQEGELVRWFDTYAYSDIVKDSGLGIVVKIYKSETFTFYQVYKSKYQLLQSYSEQDLQKYRSKK